MSRVLFAVLLLGLLAACGQREPPRNLDNACSIVKQRPNYLSAMKRTQKRWGVPVAVQMAAIYQESKFDGNARTPRKYFLWFIPAGRQSSAYGYSQALDGTWKEYQRDQRAYGARRNKIRHATDFMGWYFKGSQRALGIPLHDARNQYLAYHEGRVGYKRGSHRKKPWLLRIANEVSSRAAMYDAQLRRCRKI
jgi:hypothetical protein